MSFFAPKVLLSADGIVEDLVVSGLAAGSVSKPEPIVLWPDGAPGAIGDEAADKPQLMAYLPVPEKSTGASVIVCPGGGYCHLCEDREGEFVAEWFQSFGVAAFVLRYRIAPRYHYPIPLMDALRAIRTVRAKSGEWELDPKRIGIMGFSAGGHLASAAGTLFPEDGPEATDVIERQCSRPDFLILAYPVITMKPPYVNMGSRINLLGDSPKDGLVDLLSTETQVTSRTPRTFLFHTDSDKTVPSENSALFYLALRKAGVPAEMHIYAKGDHGIGLAKEDPTLCNWPERLRLWMKSQRLI